MHLELLCHHGSKILKDMDPLWPRCCGLFSHDRNALSLRMLEELYMALRQDDKHLRVIVLTHTGPVFSAGHDLKELVGLTE